MDAAIYSTTDHSRTWKKTYIKKKMDAAQALIDDYNGRPPANERHAEILNNVKNHNSYETNLNQNKRLYQQFQ